MEPSGGNSSKCFGGYTKKAVCMLIISLFKPNIHDAIWSHMIYKSQRVHYKIVWSYVAYDVSYRIELLSIPYDATKSYATKSQRVYWALHSCLFTQQAWLDYRPTCHHCMYTAHVQNKHMVIDSSEF